MVQTVNDLLLHKTVDHAIDQKRYSNGVVLRMVAILNKADKHLFAALTDALLRLPPESFTVQRLETLLANVRAINAEAYNALHKALETELKSLVDYETKYQADLFRHVLPVQVSVASVTPDVVYAAAIARPFQVSKNGAVPLNEYLQGLSDDRARKIRDAVRLGYISGETTDQIVKRISGTKTLNYADGLMDAPRRFVEGMVRTAINHTATVAADQFFQANEELLDGVMWVSTLDTSTSEICQALDGEVFPIDSGERPPAHINACLKGTKITTANGLVNVEDVKVGDIVLTHMNRWKKVTTVMARKHDGKAMTLIDDFGRCVRLTNEHPILTRNKGWIEAGQVNTGDIFFNNIKEFDWLYGVRKPSFVPQTFLLDAHNIKTELTEELVSYGIFSRSAGVSSSIELNNSVFDNKVGVISKNPILRRIFNVNGIKNRSKKLLVIGGICFKNYRKSVSNFLGGFFRKRRVVGTHSCGTSLGNFAHRVRLFFSPVISAAPKSDVLNIGADRFCLPHSFYSKFNASFPNGVIADSKVSFYAPQAFAISPVFGSNDINNFSISNHSWFVSTCTKIAEHHYSDYVYNLSVEDDETYIADGFLVHNCRSRVTPIVKSWRDLGIDIPEFDQKTRASMDGQVPGNLTYQTWLERQSASRQDEILGPTKGKLFRAGATVQKFVDNNGRALTIDQLRKKDAVMFEKAGL